jgi:aryl-alcohol dehydrogenase-like predicted oxidoreductase
VPFEESVGELVRLRDEGKIAHIGLSNVSAAELARAQALTPIASVQNRYNPTDRGSDALVEAAERDGFAFIPWAPVGGQQPGEGRALAAVAGRHGVSPVQVALAWQLARSPQVLPIPGTSSVAHLEQNVAAAALVLDAEDVEALGA